MSDFVETGCAVTHQGQRHEAGGASLQAGRLVAYVATGASERLGVAHKLTTWKGEELGSITFTSRWPIRSALSSHMFQARAVVDGVHYVGRTLGAGMAFSGRRARNG